jgi:hypothetical protein
MRGQGGSSVDYGSVRHCADMCWLNLHWWRQLPNTEDQWGIRKCRVCNRQEQAMYDNITGLYWVQV